MARERIWRDDWRATRAAHDPAFWRRHDRSDGFTHFGQYSEKSMRKWIALRGYSYELRLHSGQLVIVRPIADAREHSSPLPVEQQPRDAK